VFWSGLAVRGAALRQAVNSLGLALALTLGLAAGSNAEAKPPPTSTVTLASLPEQARQTYQHIGAGGPFAYAKDGVVFGNRERLLPGRARGYYREYTVKTPRARNRGARRIVCGGEQPRTPEVCYYSADHYTSFQRIVP
jgi:ribonuclease T1